LIVCLPQFLLERQIGAAGAALPGAVEALKAAGVMPAADGKFAGIAVELPRRAGFADDEVAAGFVKKFRRPAVAGRISGGGRSVIDAGAEVKIFYGLDEDVHTHRRIRIRRKPGDRGRKAKA